MARSRAEIRESQSELDEFFRSYRGQPQEQRVDMLRLLLQEPSRTLADVARALGRSERSVERWWESYARDGIAALLHVGRSGGRRPRRISAEALEELRIRLETEGFAGLDDARAWLEERYGVAYSRSGLWNLLRTGARATHGLWTVHHSRRSPRPSRADAKDGHFSGEILGFLNALPSTMDPVEWINCFRDALLELFDDIDRISIIVNTLCDLTKPQEYVPTVSIAHHNQGSTAGGSISVTAIDAPKQRFEGIVEDFRRQGFPLKEYHPPHGFDYYYEGHAYLGTVILWREVTAPALSDHTVAVFGSLEPFLTFMLTDLVTRHQYGKPVDRAFYQAWERLVEEALLSPQERRIIVLQLLGHSYKEMADQLSVTVDTIKKHFKQIHRKTGTRGQAELFAKYFTANLSQKDALVD
jgi:DNA-binding CsgD family transcriptional regulator/DNA-binding transcriptional ArsR family regulator